MGTTWAADRWTYDWMHVCLTGWMVGWLGMTNISLNIYMSATVRLWSSCSCFSYFSSNQHPWWRKHCQTRFLQQRRDGFVVCSFALKTIGQLARRQSVPVLGAGGCMTDSWSSVTVDSPLMIHCCCRWVQEINMKGHGCWFLFSRVEKHTHTLIQIYW